VSFTVHNSDGAIPNEEHHVTLSAMPLIFKFKHWQSDVWWQLLMNLNKDEIGL